jgi:hypothetical protein
MKYPIHTAEFADNELQVEIPGLFSSPRVLFEGRVVQRQFAKKNAFNFTDKQSQKHNVRLTLPWFDPAIRVNLDGLKLQLNTTHSFKAKSAILAPIVVMTFCLVLELFWPLAVMALTFPLSLLAVRAMRLNHFAKTRKILLASALLIPITLFSAALWAIKDRSPEIIPVAKKQVSHVFYEALLSSDKFTQLNRQDVVDLLEAFRTTAEFESMQLELANLPIAPQLEVSISQTPYPKLNRQVWMVRFDFTTAQIGVRDSQVLADGLGTRFERFLTVLEQR